MRAFKHLRYGMFALATLVNFANAEPLVTGIHVHKAINIREAADTGYTAIRLWDSGTSWANLEPISGEFRLYQLERTLDASEKSHLSPLLVLGSTPRWASARPGEKCSYGFGCAAEPADLGDWRRYIETVAGKFRGRIECYELWNEVSFPSDSHFSGAQGGDPNEFFSGSINTLIDMAKEAYEVIRDENPEACILSPSIHPSGNWAKKFDLYLEEGGGQYFDVVSQHFYFTVEPEQAVPVIRTMRAILAKHHLNTLPIWNTEVGTDFFALHSEWPEYSLEELVYAFVLRTYLVNASEGVARVYWYAWDNRTTGFTNPDTGREFGIKAVSAALNLLKGATKITCHNAETFWSCSILREGHETNVVWLSGKSAPPVSVFSTEQTYRWNRVPKPFPVGVKVDLNAIPLVID